MTDDPVEVSGATFAEYKATMDRLGLIARLLLDTDPEALKRARAFCERVDTLGPVLDPTMYRDGGAQNVRDQSVVIDAMTAARKALAPLRDRLTAALDAVVDRGEEAVTDK